MQLRRFWFVFVADRELMALGLGCGITAHDRNDAMNILRERVFNENTRPVIQECIEDVDVSTLDPRHILPNMGAVAIRGVWFPLRFDACRPREP